MRISTDHRALTKVYDAATYRELATLVGKAFAKSSVTSVVLCGSTAKDDLVPGWSDLDIVVVSGCEHTTVAEMNVARDAIEAAWAFAEIGVGIDLSGIRGLRQEGRIGGRPLAMTYEVAQYGKILFGTDALNQLPPPLEVRSAQIAIESWPLILAELHNWQRTYCHTHGESQSNGLYAATIKVWLKVLKHLVEPDTRLPFTHQSYLDVFSEKNTDLSALRKVLGLAVACRAGYATEDRSSAAWRDKLEILVGALTDPTLLAEVERAHARRP